MDNNQIVELFISRGLIDRSLGQDILHEVENSGKEAAEILAGRPRGNVTEPIVVEIRDRD